ncbi:MAG: hypothetical protein JOZ41_02765, partial [Chloroflexi bacterium]|nr:hypothetical protein [Chloroflexota bacterium]
NSYSISAVEQPGNKPVTLAKPVDITLLWPYIPIGMDEYRNGTWRQICNQDQAVLTASTLGCSTSTLGTFVAIASPRTAGIHLLVTPASSSRFAWINRYIPVLAALGVIILAAVMGYIVSRPDRKKLQP